jgi:hypothetical protein
MAGCSLRFLDSRALLSLSPQENVQHDDGFPNIGNNSCACGRNSVHEHAVERHSASRAEDEESGFRADGDAICASEWIRTKGAQSHTCTQDRKRLVSQERLGGAAARQPLEGDRQILELSALFEFRSIDLRTLIQASILNGGGGGDRERVRKSKMLVVKAVGNGMAG